MRNIAGVLVCCIVSLALGGLSYAGDGVSTAGDFDQDALFSVVGARYGLDPSLLKAIAAVESGGQTRAVSRAGAMGLMQLMPATARRFRVGNPFDPVENVLGAARFLAHLKRQQLWSNGEVNVVDLLAAYNAGEGAVKQYKGVPPYAETQGYVRRVLWRYVFDEELFQASNGAPVGVTQRDFEPSREWVEAAYTGDGNSAGERMGDDALLEQLAELRKQRARATEK